MALLEGIRKKAGLYLLQKRMKANVRNRKLVSIYSAGSVAILFEFTDQSVYQGVHKYFQALQEKKIKVKALGFANNRLVTNQFLPVLTFDTFTRKNLNWAGVPQSTGIKDFIESEFDICINLAPENIFPLQYIAAASKARLKAGTYTQSDPEDPACLLPSIYDILIKSEDPHDQIECLKNIHEYFIMLNPRENG